jgi:protoporphyrinogen oxidase
MNNMIKNQMKIFSLRDSNNIFKIKLKTSFDKYIISKDATGTATNYKINTKINFAFNKNKKDYKINFDENFNVKNISNTYEQTNYERIVIENFARSAVENLIIKLMSIDDN